MGIYGHKFDSLILENSYELSSLDMMINEAYNYNYIMEGLFDYEPIVVTEGNIIEVIKGKVLAAWEAIKKILRKIKEFIVEKLFGIIKKIGEWFKRKHSLKDIYKKAKEKAKSSKVKNEASIYLEAGKDAGVLTIEDIEEIERRTVECYDYENYTAILDTRLPITPIRISASEAPLYEVIAKLDSIFMDPIKKDNDINYTKGKSSDYSSIGKFDAKNQYGVIAWKTNKITFKNNEKVEKTVKDFIDISIKEDILFPLSEDRVHKLESEITKIIKEAEEESNKIKQELAKTSSINRDEIDSLKDIHDLKNKKDDQLEELQHKKALTQRLYSDLLVFTHEYFKLIADYRKNYNMVLGWFKGTNTEA